MNSTTEFTDPQNRSFVEEISALDTKTLRQRYKDIESYMEDGIRPNWTIIVDPCQSILNIKFWAPEDFLNYRRLLMMELLDRCKSFDLIPKIKFHF